MQGTWVQSLVRKLRPLMPQLRPWCSQINLLNKQKELKKEEEVRAHTPACHTGVWTFTEWYQSLVFIRLSSFFFKVLRNFLDTNIIIWITSLKACLNEKNKSPHPCKQFYACMFLLFMHSHISYSEHTVLYPGFKCNIIKIFS